MRLRYWCGITRLMNILRIDMDAENFPYPRKEPRQFFSAKLVSTSTNDYMSVFAEIEVGIAKTPNVKAFVLVGAGHARCIRLDELWYACSQTVILPWICCGAPRNCLEMPAYGVGIFNERHYQMVRVNVVKISGMHKYPFLFQQHRRSFLFVTIEWNRDVEAAPRFHELCAC